MRKGQVLIAAIFVVVIVTVLGVTAASLLSTGSFSAVKNLHGVQALNVAEGGVRFTLAASLAADSDWTDNADFGPVSLNPGTFTVRYLWKIKKQCTLEVTGTVQGVSRILRGNFKKNVSSFPSQFEDYGAYVGTGAGTEEGVNFYNQSKILGNFYLSGTVKIFPPRPPPAQTTGIIYSAAIDPLPAFGIPNYYNSWEAIGTAEPYVLDDSYYIAWLNQATVEGASNLNLTGNSELNLAGGTASYKSVDVRGTAHITGPGTLYCKDITFWADSYVTGPVTICATTKISTRTNANSVFYNAVRFVSRGSPTSVDISGTTSWPNTLEVIGLNDVKIGVSNATPMDAVIYSKSNSSSNLGIVVNGSAQPRGTFLAPYGTITNDNNGHLRGAVLAYDYVSHNQATVEGGLVLLHIASFYNDTMVIQNDSVLAPATPPGITAETPGIDISNYGLVYN
ncbi:hypothetical protein A2625_00380 [candidate division WOR-1 bacterium RIFCSPHIGHO2_01_FULL_53_15]|uniref:Type 4 fimbrial biogenesis protein PilX N-terminal domain-containing protein n=1 Tax=candidate division WOR-1 bacterium RIFCSPHIGHO2_01_FULL_53_15 TaxID=1802564 RepID=A0A1F4PZ30_UNCSA|nr:MAG: hypothetical protein A2625_00380 [candidate division WOR-1 bacterium RIFCSPHIGHO2_01_FULL_53_15]